MTIHLPVEQVAMLTAFADDSRRAGPWAEAVYGAALAGAGRAGAA